MVRPNLNDAERDEKQNHPFCLVILCWYMNLGREILNNCGRKSQIHVNEQNNKVNTYLFDLECV